MQRIHQALFIAAVLASAAACAGAKQPAPSSTEKTSMPATRETAEQLFARHSSGAPFEVQVGGATFESFWKKRRCAYTEWAFGTREGGVLTSFTVAEKQGDGLLLIEGAREAPVGIQQVRLFLSPALERELKKGETDLPDELRQLADEGQINYLAEYCLEPGRSYHAMVREEKFSLPPAGPGGEPRTRTSNVLVISDRPFVDGKPQGEVLPSFRSWSY